MRSNFKVFFSLDKIHKNGQIDWDEYYQYFTRTRMGLEDGDIRRLETDPRSVSREVREALAEVKAAWSEAARTNPDAVNIDEFLGLEHPESSHTLLTQRVEVIKCRFSFWLRPELRVSQCPYGTQCSFLIFLCQVCLKSLSGLSLSSLFS